MAKSKSNVISLIMGIMALVFIALAVASVFFTTFRPKSQKILPFQRPDLLLAL